MKIETMPGVQAQRTIRKRGAVGEGFADLLSDLQENDIASTSALASTSDLSMVIGLQGFDYQETERRHKKILRHGKKILESLFSLQKALLSPSKKSLQTTELEGLLADLSQGEMALKLASDDKLRETIEQLKVRAAVEIAKQRLVAVSDSPQRIQE